MKKLMTLASVLALTAGTALAEDIRVGVSPGEHAEIMEEVAKVAEQEEAASKAAADPGKREEDVPKICLPAAFSDTVTNIWKHNSRF